MMELRWLFTCSLLSCALLSGCADTPPGALTPERTDFGMVTVQPPSVSPVLPVSDQPLLVTMTNDVEYNRLVTYDGLGRFITETPTPFKGGVSGNAGGLALSTDRRLLAVVNARSSAVGIYSLARARQPVYVDLIKTADTPVSATFSADDRHLYVLTVSHVASYARFGDMVEAVPEGTVALQGTNPAQVAYVPPGRLLVTNKGDDIGMGGTVESVSLVNGAVVTGSVSTLMPLPAGTYKMPFGIGVTSDQAVVTLARSNQYLALSSNVLTDMTSPEALPRTISCWTGACWSANSDGKSITALHLRGMNVVIDDPKAATFDTFEAGPSEIVAIDTYVAALVREPLAASIVLYEAAAPKLTIKTRVVLGPNALRANGIVVIPPLK